MTLTTISRSLQELPNMMQQMLMCIIFHDLNGITNHVCIDVLLGHDKEQILSDVISYLPFNL